MLFCKKRANHQGWLYGFIMRCTLLHAHLKNLLHIGLLQRLEAGQGATTDGFLGHHCEVGAVDAHLGEGALQLQGVEEEVAQLLNGLVSDVHWGQAWVDAEDVGAKLHIFRHGGLV